MGKFNDLTGEVFGKLTVIKYIGSDKNRHSLWLTAWARHFFAGTKSATIDNNYNESARSGSGKTEAIKTRLEAITADYNRFILKVA